MIKHVRITLFVGQVGRWREEGLAAYEGQTGYNGLADYEG